jgi:hypothetical protein
MNDAGARTTDRRAWLATCMRGAACAGLAGTAGLLVARGQVRGCPRAGHTCGSCPDLIACTLPPAAAARRRSAQKGGR